MIDSIWEVEVMLASGEVRYYYAPGLDSDQGEPWGDSQRPRNLTLEQRVTAYVAEKEPSLQIKSILSYEMAENLVVRCREADWIGWLPEPANINALPAPVRQYIHDLEARCDPAGEVAELTLIRDQNRMLQARIVQLESRITQMQRKESADVSTDSAASS